MSEVAKMQTKRKKGQVVKREAELQHKSLQGGSEPVLVDRSGDIAGHGLQLLSGIPHRHTQTGSFNERDVISPITEGDGLIYANSH